MDVVAQNLLQGSIQQMGGAVGTHDGLPAVHVDGGGNGVAHLELAGDYLAVMHELAALVLQDVGDLKLGLTCGDHAVVGHLAAHLGVEGGLVQHQDRLGAGDHLVPQFLVGHDGQNFASSLGMVIADELGGGHVAAELDAGPAQVAQGLTGLAGADTLLLHLLVEALAVQGHALVLHHLGRQVDGEAICVIQLEGVGAGEHRLALSLVVRQQLVEDLHAAVDGLGEVLLLGADHLSDIGLLLPQVGIGGLVLMDDGLHHFIQEGLIDAQQLAVAGGPTQQAAQHVAPALVAGQDAVADHHGGGADVVGDNTQGHISLVALAVVGAGDLGHLVGDVHDGVHIEQRVHVLDHAGQTLQAHSGVDVLVLHLGVVALAVVDEL